MSTRAELVHTASPERTLEERDLAVMRPATESAPRARKPRAARKVTGGIVCFCGERFPETRALEFMRHLRAEVGEVLDRDKRYREYIRKWHARRREDPEYRARAREAVRRRRAAKKAEPQAARADQRG